MATAKKTTKKTEEVKSLEQLREDLVKAQQDLDDSRRSHAHGELVNVHVLTTQRKAIARLHTAIKAAESEEGKESK